MTKIRMDGQKNGFAIKDQASGEFAQGKKGNQLFRSVELARIYAANRMGIKTPFGYSIAIFIGGKQYSFSDVVYCNNIMYLDIDGEMHELQEGVLNTVLFAGYCIFEDGDTKRIEDYNEGREKYKLVFDTISEACHTFAKKKILKRVKVNGLRSIEAEINYSTATIHFFSNVHLIYYNKERKENGERCLVFDKGMDRYLTMYYFVTRETSEVLSTNMENDSDAIVQEIFDYIATNMEVEGLDTNSLKYMPMEFVGAINI